VWVYKFFQRGGEKGISSREFKYGIIKSVEFGVGESGDTVYYGGVTIEYVGISMGKFCDLRIHILEPRQGGSIKKFFK
jgi:hypothetical protein